MLDCVATRFSKGSSRPRDQTHCRQTLYRLSHLGSPGCTATREYPLTTPALTPSLIAARESPPTCSNEDPAWPKINKILKKKSNLNCIISGLEFGNITAYTLESVSKKTEQTTENSSLAYSKDH